MRFHVGITTGRYDFDFTKVKGGIDFCEQYFVGIAGVC